MIPIQNLAISLGVLVLFSVLGIWEAKRQARNHADLNLETLHHQAKYIYLIIICIITALAGITIPMMNRTLMWQAPVWFDVYGVSLKFAVIIACFSFLFSLSSAVAILTRHKERNGIILASFLLVFSFLIFQYQYGKPVYPGLNRLKTDDGVVLQSSPSSCAAASGANIALALGRNKSTEKEMAALMNTSGMIGTNAGQVIHAMEQAGIRCSKRWIKNFHEDKPAFPAMFFIDSPEIGPESHAVAFMGYRGEKMEIWDPLEGKVFFTPAEAQKFWHGKSLECSLAK